jgi:hypothetical protein
VLGVEPGRLLVSLPTGERLDPNAAEVLIALGGEEPDWLRVVDGLEAVFIWVGFKEQHLAAAAEVLGLKAARRVALAKETSDPVVLAALAGGGQAQVAANPACTAYAWDLLARHRSDRVRAKAGELGYVLPPELHLHPDPDVRLRVARNPRTPPEVLARYGRSPATGTPVFILDARWRAIQRAVAENPATPPRALALLARISRDGISLAVANNAHTPRATLFRLAHDFDVRVRAAAAANDHYPPWLAGWMAADRYGYVRSRVAARGDLSGRALSWVERYARADGDLYRQTRWRLSQNPAARPSLQKRLAKIEREDRARAANGSGPRPPATGSMTGVIGGVVAVAVFNSGGAAAIRILTAAWLWSVPIIALTIPFVRWVARHDGRPYRPLPPPRPRTVLWIAAWALILWSAHVPPSPAITVVVAVYAGLRLLFQPLRRFLIRANEQQVDRRFATNPVVLVLGMLAALLVIVISTGGS